MKKIIILVLFFMLPVSVSYATEMKKTLLVETGTGQPVEFENSARSAILIEKETGGILLEKNAYERLGMASTTKIMTAIVALENSELTDIVKASHRASMIEGTSIYLAEGEEMLMEDLLYALLLNSGNDCATAIAEHIGKTEENFVKMMNDKALELGLKDTHFTNPHGLADANHYTTSYELAKMASYALHNPKFAEIVATEKKRISRQREGGISFLKNHNRLLRDYEYCTGVKTGFTKKTGRTLVSSAKKDNIEVICVTLNDGDDWRDHKEMLEYGLNNYKTKILYCKDELIEGKEVGEDVYVCLKDGEKYDIKIDDKINIYVDNALQKSYEFKKPDKKVIKQKSLVQNFSSFLYRMVSM